MNPVQPDKVKESFALIRHHTDPILHPLIDELERRMLVHEAMLALRVGIEEDLEEIANPGHSVKVWESDARSNVVPILGEAS